MSIQAGTLLRRPWQVFFQASWLLLFLALLASFIVALPVFYARLLDLTYAEQTFGYTAYQTRLALDELGLSPRAFAGIVIAVAAPFTLLFFVTGLLIFWLRSRDWIALLVSITLVMFGWGLYSIPYSLVYRLPAFQVFSDLVAGLMMIAVPLLCYLFPDGRFVPRWIRWLLPFWSWQSLTLMSASAASGWQMPKLPPALSISIAGFMYLSLLFAPLYRYLRVASHLQRQQIKWVVFAFLSIPLGVVLFVILPGIALSLGYAQALDRGGAGLLYYLVAGGLMTFVFMLVPLSIAISILRYRLWDIDVIVRRTLVYGVLTTLLSLLYVGGVIALQALVRSITGVENSQAAVVASTLAVAALFTPLRQRVQQVIDRRFYRRKYDAERTLAAFAVAARQETDLEQLVAELVRIVIETIQPEHASLWMAAGEDRKFPWLSGEEVYVSKDRLAHSGSRSR